MRIYNFLSNKQYWTVQGISSWAEVFTCKLLLLVLLSWRYFFSWNLVTLVSNRLVDFSCRSASRCVLRSTFLLGLDQMLKTGLRFAGRKIWKKAEEFIYSEETISRTAAKTWWLCAGYSWSCGSLTVPQCRDSRFDHIGVKPDARNKTICRGSQNISGETG